MHVELLLYTREECHLCELAAKLLDEVAPDAAVQPVNIDEDLGLLSRYGERVPVLRRPDTGAELGWPFNAAEVGAFLK